MEFKTAGQDDQTVVLVQGTGTLVTTAQDMLDMIATAAHLHNSRLLVLRKEQLAEAFFDLKTGLAGEVLQKVTNYDAALAIVGDFSGYTSRALRDFIYESNNGRQVFFLPDEATAVSRLQSLNRH